MQKPKTWYELLGRLVDTPKEKQHLANQLNVSVITVTRWIAHTSKPRPAMLRAILSAFPEHRGEFMLLLAEDQIHWLDDDQISTSQDGHIPSNNFYMQLLSAYRQLSPTLRSTTIQQLVLSDAIEHLDPQQLGIACTLLLCLPPRADNPVRSLYIADGKGTNPWPQDLRQTCNLFGAESLAGAVTTAGRPLLADCEDDSSHIVPSRWGLHERSAFAAPIMRGLQIAGCFLVSSTLPGTFLSSMQERIICYADMLVLTIETDQWYDHSRINLKLMPSKEIQLPLFINLPQQTIARMVQDGSYTYTTMRQQLIQEIEEDLIQLTETSRPETQHVHI